jgi:integrase
MGLTYVDVRLGAKTLLRDWHKQWVQTLTVAKSTRATYGSAWRVHIEPYLGDRGVSSISRMDVQKWQADLERKYATPMAIKKNGTDRARMRAVALQVLSNMLQMACQSSPPLRLDNPCLGVKPPAHEPEPGYALSVVEAQKLLIELGDDDLLVDLMLSCGLRWSEAAAVKTDAIDFGNAFLHVRRKLTQAGELLDYGKSSAANRHVPGPERLLRRLEQATPGVGVHHAVGAAESPRGRAVDVPELAAGDLATGR